MCLLAAMKLLLAAATEAELGPLLAHLQKLWASPEPFIFVNGGTEIHICITGVGMMATAYRLAKQLPTAGYDFAVQAGVGGSFSTDISLGELVHVTSDRYGDLGAEDHYNFIDVIELGLLGKDEAPFANGVLSSAGHPLHEKMPQRKATGLTVNTVSGSDFTIKSRIDKFGCDVESMEGVAFHYACLQEHVPFAQVRAISNYVTPRDKESWKMKDAVINLNEWLIGFIESM
jgi:futalosine hydrolase